MKAPDYPEWRGRFAAAGYRIGRDLDVDGVPVGFVATWDLPFSTRPLAVAVGIGLSVVEDVERFGAGVGQHGTTHVRLFVTERPGLVRRPCIPLEIRAVAPSDLYGREIAVPGMGDLSRSTGRETLRLPLVPGPMPVRVERSGGRAVDAERVAAIRAAMRADGAPRAVCFVEEIDPQVERVAGAQGIDLIPESFPTTMTYRQHQLVRKAFLHAFVSWRCAGCSETEPCDIELEMGETEASLRRGSERVVYRPGDIAADLIPSLEMRYGRPLALVASYLPAGVQGYGLVEDHVERGGDVLLAIVRRVRRHAEQILAATGPNHDGPQRTSLTSCGRYRTTDDPGREGVLLVPYRGRGKPEWFRIRERTPRYYVLVGEPADAGDVDLPTTGLFRRTAHTGRNTRFEQLDLFPAGGGAPMLFRLATDPEGRLRAYLREPVADVTPD